MTTTAIGEKGMLFSSPMVRAIMAGRKVQTRRICNPQPIKLDGTDAWERCPYRVGMTLWVRETFKLEYNFNEDYGEPDNPLGPVRWHEDEDYGRWFECPRYRASEPDCELAGDDGPVPWTPSIYMPKWASRILLEVTEVRVERLQDITENDAQMEGFTPYTLRTEGKRTARRQFQETWWALNGKRAGGAYVWERNPWVWPIAFRVLTTNRKLP